MDISLAPGCTGVAGVDLSRGPGIFGHMHAASVPGRSVPSQSPRTVRLVLDVPAAEDAWVLPEEDMPESNPHREAVRRLELLLLAFVARTGRNALVAGNLACRWYEAEPRIGVDPDVALIEPAPPEAAKLKSLRTWEPGHVPPRFAVEIVSASNPTKDYDDAPAKYAALGTRELVVFDPELIGPHSGGGPHLLQVWRRDDAGAMVRVHAGTGPARTEELAAWLVPTTDGHLRIADDEQGSQPWVTEAETEAAARKQAESALRGAVETARAAVEDLCEILAIPLDDARRAHLASLDAAGLESLRASLKRARAWPH